MEIKYIYYLINNKIILCIYIEYSSNIEYEKVNKYFRIFIHSTHVMLTLLKLYQVYE